MVSRMQIDKKIAFIGTGFMAGAMIGGLVRAGKVAAENIFAVNPVDRDSAEALADKYGVINGKPEDIEKADVVMFAVKPQDFDTACEMYIDFFTEDKLYLSIMAGISTEKLENKLSGARTVRLMPNLALSVGKSATVYALGKNAVEEDASLTEELFSVMGIIHRVDENMISAVTALSGSGPAYFYLLAEEMAKSAAADGMDPELAETLAVQTLVGTAELISQSKESPREMRRRITSKKGTTEAAVDAMLESGFADTVAKGYMAARLRSDELGK